ARRPHAVKRGGDDVFFSALACAIALSVAPAAVCAADVAVTFRVTLPAATPAGARVWLSGDLPALGAWNGAGLALAPAPGGRHDGVLRVPAGTRFEFKATRGGWDTVEKGTAGEEIGNRTLTARRDTTIAITIAAWRDQVAGGGGGATAARPTTLTGDVRRHAQFPSKFVKARDVWVWLPPGYGADTARRYPVLYFHDGNNVFDRATSFLGVEWAVDETAERLVKAATLPPFIAVAVANTGDRMAEYTPTADPQHGGGRAAAYGRFLVEELKPFVDSTYRSDPRPAATGVVGSSLGAIVSLWLGLEHPQAFTRIGVVSPAAWFAGGDLERRASAATGAGLRVWIDIGTAEGSSVAGRRATVEGARAVRDALLARGYREGTNLHYEEVEGALHNEGAWAARVDRLLVFLLADLPSPPGPVVAP
ncbi:MAG: alpha/beta hydrolase-fold protein, partial [Candidatus Eisenbacteria bacterium]